MLSNQSKRILSSCHQDLWNIITKLAETESICVLHGYRGEKEQNELFVGGFSKLEFPNSKHNSKPANAVDIAPFPVKWEKEDFIRLATRARAIANEMGIEITCGALDWPNFFDGPHIERRILA